MVADAAGDVLRLDTSSVRAVGLASVTLAAVSGYVDAYVFVRVASVFTANQSGNLILEGVAIGARRPGEIALPLVSIVAYVVGAAAAVALFDRAGDGGRRRFRATLMAECGLVAVAALVLAAAGLGRELGRPDPTVGLVVAAVSLAMGAQATLVRRWQGVPVLTTAGTGAITNLGIAVGRAAGPTERRKAAAVVVRVVGGIVVAYVAGAAVGALLATATGLGPELLLAACLPLAALVLVQRAGG